MLWTSLHTHGGVEDFMITAPARSADDAQLTRIAAGELAGADVVVSYRIADLDQYVRGWADPEAILETIADRQISAYFASHDIDTLLATGRLVAADELRQMIAEEVSREQLGMEVLLVSVASVHPPQPEDVAKAFHEQIGALQEVQSAIENAQRDAIQTLAEVAANLYALIQKMTIFRQRSRRKSPGFDVIQSRASETQ